MITTASVERRIAAMLADEGLVRAPESALADVLTVVDGTTQRRRTWPSPVIAVPRMDSRQRLIVALAAALLIAGIVVAGALLARPPDPSKDLSSLVILEHQPFIEGGPPRPVGVVAIARDGSQRSVMTIEPSQLDGRYSEWYAGLSVDGHLVVPTTTEGGASAPAVLDLRDPTAHAISPDAEGAFPHFGPDGRLAMSQNDGRVAIFDPLTARTSRIDAAAMIGLAEHDFGPVWTAEGGLLTTTGPAVDGHVTGQVDPDDLTTTSDAHPYYAGVGARRVDHDGRLLRCDPASDESCEGLITLHAITDASPVVWTQSDMSVRVIDYAWAIDGGIWILTETAAAGPRTVELLHVDMKGGSESIATLSGGADDPDPSSYSQAASFAAFSSDDARIVVAVAGQPPQLWSVDPRARRSTRLPDGIVAGWLAPNALSAPRPQVERAPELPDAIRGEWTRDHLQISVRRRSIDIGTHGVLGATTATVAPDGSVQIIEAKGTCAGITGTYQVESGGDALRLTAVDDACPDRIALLAGSYERALGHPDTGSVPIVPGTRYVATDFTVPFRVTIPAGHAAYVDSNKRDFLNISAMIEGSMATVTLVVPQGDILQPCGVSPTGKRTPYPDWVPAFLDKLIEVDFEQVGFLDVGTEPTRLVRAIPRDDTCEQAASFATAQSFHSIPIAPSTPMGVIERGGVHILILLARKPDSTAEVAWVRDLLGSIEWLQ